MCYSCDNARPHTAALTQQTLENIHWGTVEHSPYSPNLLFGSLNEVLGKEKFENDTEWRNSYAIGCLLAQLFRITMEL